MSCLDGRLHADPVNPAYLLRHLTHLKVECSSKVKYCAFESRPTYFNLLLISVVNTLNRLLYPSLEEPCHKVSIQIYGGDIKSVEFTTFEACIEECKKTEGCVAIE